jgi:RNA polymerase sigma factor (sigma-70 family)
MFDDTRIGGSSSKFPATRRSAIVASSSAHPEERRQAFEKIVAAYWKPVYKLVRFQWCQSNEDAKDLTQAFFARAMEKHFFKDYCPKRGSFRTFVRTCVTHFVINESKHSRRAKRGGDQVMVPLEDIDRAGAQTVDELFEREWIRNLFSLAVDDLRTLCESRQKMVHFRIFERYDLDADDLSYAQVAGEFAVSVTDVTNYLSWCRREVRRLVMERIRDLTVDDAEFRREASIILGG